MPRYEVTATISHNHDRQPHSYADTVSAENAADAVAAYAMKLRRMVPGLTVHSVDSIREV